MITHRLLGEAVNRGNTVGTGHTSRHLRVVQLDERITQDWQTNTTDVDTAPTVDKSRCSRRPIGSAQHGSTATEGGYACLTAESEGGYRTW